MKLLEKKYIFHNNKIILINHYFFCIEIVKIVFTELRTVYLESLDNVMETPMTYNNINQHMNSSYFNTPLIKEQID